MTRPLLAVLVALIAACAARPPEAAPSASAPPARPPLPAAGSPAAAPPDPGPSAAAPPSLAVPLTARWVVRATSPVRLDLTARITFRSPIADAVTVSVALPQGVALASGSPAQTVAPPAGGGVVELDYGFALAAGASGEIALTADLQAPGFGLHARDVYPVGAAAQRKPAPAAEPTGPRVKVGGKDLGPSTELR